MADAFINHADLSGTAEGLIALKFKCSKTESNFQSATGGEQRQLR